MSSLNEIISSCTGDEDQIQSATFNYDQETMLIDKCDDIENNCGKETLVINSNYNLKVNTKTEANHEKIIDVNNIYRAEYNDLGNCSSGNLNITHRNGLPFSFFPNNKVNDLDSKLSGLNLGLNKTFDANWETTNELFTIPQDNTNLSTTKPELLKFEHCLSTRLDSEESLGIIPDLLDDNTSLDLLVPFPSHKSSLKLVSKFQDTNCFTFSPLRVSKKMKVSLAEEGSPLKRNGNLRFTSTPKQLSAKLTLMKNSENDQDCGSKGGIEEVNLNDLKECYDDFKKGNIFTSTSKRSSLQDSLNILETTNTLKDTSTIENKDVSSILLNATFQIQPESIPEMPLKVLADTLPIPSENVSRNKTITIENINGATEVFENEGKYSSIDLPGSMESKKLNLTEIISSDSFSGKSDKVNPSNHDSFLIKSIMPTNLKSKSKLRKSLSVPMQEQEPLIDHDSYLVEGKKQISCKTKIKLRKSLSTMQKLDPPKFKNNKCSELNSTICLKNKKPANSFATNLRMRYSLSAVPTTKTRSSTSGMLKTHPLLKSKCVDSEVDNKLTLKTANSVKSSKNRDSLIKQKSSTRNSCIGSIIKPQVLLQIKNETEDEVFVKDDEKTSLDSTFVKDEIANVKKVLSPINEVHKLKESQMENLSLSHSERNGTFSLSFESCVDEVNKASKCLSREEANLVTQTASANRTIAAPKKHFVIPVINTKILKKDEASKKKSLIKPKEFSKDKLSTEKNIRNNRINFIHNIKEKELNNDKISKNYIQLPIKAQNVNLNEKRNCLKATNQEQYSSLPTLRSTFSKYIPERTRIGSKIHIESKNSEESFPSHSSSNNKLQKKASVQTAISLRPAEVSHPKENEKMKNSSVPDETVALCDEIDKSEKFDISPGIQKPKFGNSLPSPKQIGGAKTGSKIPAFNASRQIPSLRKILPPKTYTR